VSSSAVCGSGATCGLGCGAGTAPGIAVAFAVARPWVRRRMVKYHTAQPGWEPSRREAIPRPSFYFWRPQCVQYVRYVEGPFMLPMGVVFQVKSGNYSPKYIEQDAKQGPSSQFAERAGSGLYACPISKESAWAECTCAGARFSIFLSFSVARGSLILPPPRSATRRSASKYNTGPREVGALSLISTPCSVHRVEHFHVV
jgi:hypothetical protein